MTAPSSTRTILIAVTGMSPAVLTETVWALAFPLDKDTAPIIPDRVIALTTTAGRDAIVQQLFGSDRIWERLREAVLGAGYKTDPRLCFGVTGDCVKVFTRRSIGKPVELKDISTKDENTAVADFITNELWSHVAKPDTRIVASISGGFKTMSALLFAGMSLLGRKDDLITHVLVNQPFDDPHLTPRFYFPKQAQQALKDRNGKVWDARDAQLRLGFVPFVPLNDLLEKFKRPRSYSDLVARCRGNLNRRLRQPVNLRLSVSRREVTVNDVTFRLAPQPFLFLLFLAQRARDGAPPLGKYSETLEPLQRFASELATQWAKRRMTWAAPGKKILPKDFGDAVSKHDESPIRTKLLWGITQQLRNTPGAAVLEAYLPESSRCTLDLPPANIEILD